MGVRLMIGVGANDYSPRSPTPWFYRLTRRSSGTGNGGWFDRLTMSGRGLIPPHNAAHPGGAHYDNIRPTIPLILSLSKDALV